MPFGNSCEFKTFEACEKKYKGKVKDTGAYCASIMKATEKHCAKRASNYAPTRRSGLMKVAYVGGRRR